MEPFVWSYIKSFVCILITLFALQPTSLRGVDHTCSNFIELKKTVEKIVDEYFFETEDIIVLFDVSNTLMVSRRDFFGVLDELEQMFPRRNSSEDEWNQWCRLCSIYKRDREVELVDDGLLEWVCSLQKRAFKTIAITHTAGGKFGIVDDIEQLRIDNLFSLGLDFRFQIDNYPETRLFCIGEKTFSFRSGILFTNLIDNEVGPTGVALLDKGLVFAWFLEDLKTLVGWQPKLVVFIDDMPRFIRSVQDAMLLYPQIKFEAIHYTQVVDKAHAISDKGKRMIQNLLENGKLRDC